MIQGPNPININLEDAEDVVCDECEYPYFMPVFAVKKISALLSPAGQETHIPLQQFCCAKCGHVNESFL